MKIGVCNVSKQREWQTFNEVPLCFIDFVGVARNNVTLYPFTAPAFTYIVYLNEVSVYIVMFWKRIELMLAILSHCFPSFLFQVFIDQASDSYQNYNMKNLSYT